MLRKLFKPVVACVLTMSFLLSTGGAVFAADNKTTPTPQTYSKDTVITESNLNDILKVHNIDPSKIVKNTKTVSSTVTVGDLEKALEEAKKMPKKITSNDTAPLNLSTNGTLCALASGSGTSIATRATTYTNTLTVDYYATGAYTDGMWSYALGSSWAPRATGIPTSWWTVTQTYSNHIYLYSASTPYAYLSQVYNYDITNYIGVLGYGIPNGTINIQGTINYSNAYI
ncbi:hypothetical protein [Desulfosporosinus metallidurans]|uniref:Uncharacterized protein n=1 Tax=Desulfosporosinus metallidurans TaxID=1888891 RepID=A0A1Q8QCX6_9FIRM|nr:hypothetical protein [Desulfosporosinus metallidurans]OLN25190.1 hypothetical protein DSOL_5363 [Desulfosporosinus metallidurans]